MTSQQMITDLTRSALAPRLPSRWQSGQNMRSGHLEVYERLRRQPIARFETLRDGQPEIGIEGWIEKYEIERGAAARSRSSKPAQCVCPNHLDLVGAPLAAMILQRRDTAPIGFETQHACRTARGRLEPERTAAGEGIKNARTADYRREPIKEGFAHPIGSRSNRRAGWKTDFPTAPLPRDDANFVGVGHPRRRVA